MSIVNTNYGAGTANAYSKYYDAKKTEGAGFAQKVAEKAAVSTEDMTLDEYKAYFQEKMDALYTHPSQRNMNWVIDITDAAYERMKKDPEYEQKVLNCFAVNKSVNFGSYIPVYSYTHIDDTWEKSYGYTQGMKKNDPTSSESSGGGLGEWWQERHERFEELLKEQVKAAQKREQLNKGLVKQVYRDGIDQRTALNRIILANAAYEKQVVEESSGKLVARGSD